MASAIDTSTFIEGVHKLKFFNLFKKWFSKEKVHLNTSNAVESESETQEQLKGAQLQIVAEAREQEQQARALAEAREQEQQARALAEAREQEQQARALAEAREREEQARALAEARE
ncbi:MAG: hypothetical protein UHX00_01385, partial [Caryophanon sp.]|nr:hypothetical protein [Caryophanon sp.]